jgi:serine-type D-Ala-D-Ala carboxypeptidase/endopeptidase
MKTWSAIAVVTLLLAPQAPGLGAQHFAATQELELLLRYMVEDGEAPAVVLGVLEPDGSTRLATWYGPDPTQGDGRTVFELGSVTKTFTATLLADMVLSGDVRLEDPVERYLPEGVRVPSVGGRTITLLDLATHRSALPEFPPELERVGPDGLDEPYKWEDGYAFLEEYALPWAPGTRSQYSSFGYGLLGHALGRALGTTYREALRARVLGPLGMETAVFSGEDAEGVTVISGHRSGQPVRQRLDVEVLDGSGALRASGEDMLKFLAANVGPPEGRLEEAMRLAHAIQNPDGRGGGRGLAWGTSVFPGQSPVVGHSGSTIGFRSHIAFAREQGTGVVLLSNDNGFSDSALATTLLFMGPVPPSWAMEQNLPVVDAFAGTYEPISGSGRIYIRLEDEGWLTYQPPGKARTRLYLRSDSSFYMLRGPWTLTFRTGPDGSTRLTMVVDLREPSQEGVTREFRKVAAETPSPTSVASTGLSSRKSFPVWFFGGLALAAGLVAAAFARRRLGASI